MTAPELTPTAEHTDAVARVVAGLLDDFDTVMNVRAESREVARRLLTSTDPAVHSALLDALVRAGVLTEDRERLVRACGCIANEEPAACCDPLASPHWERRYVTRWVAL